MGLLKISRLRVVDGDTFIGLVKFRLADVRAVEMYTPDGKLSDEGLRAKMMLIDALPRKMEGYLVAVDVYGRGLLRIQVPELHLPETFPYGGREVQIAPDSV